VHLDVSCVKNIELVTKYSLVSVTQFRHHADLFCNSGIYQISDSANIDDVVRLALSQEG